MLYEKKNYTIDIPFLHSVMIREYDIQKANISILYKYGVIDYNKYIYLYNAPRDVRQYVIGNLQKDNSITQILQNGIMESRRLLFESNYIEDSDIVSIKNDAIFILNKECNVTQFDGINFTLRNVYNLFTKVGPTKKTEIYYGLNMMTGEECIDVKGINDTTLELHSNYFIQLLCEIFYMMESNPSSIVLSAIYNIYNNYIGKTYPIGYYREFNSSSKYRLIDNRSIKSFVRLASNVGEEYKDILDISYNANILRDIYGYISSLYFKYN